MVATCPGCNTALDFGDDWFPDLADWCPHCEVDFVVKVFGDVETGEVWLEEVV